MGFNSGSVSFVRFNVIGEAPNTPSEAWLEKAFALMLKEVELTSSEVEYGWCGGAHVLDEEDLTFGRNVYADCLFLGLHVVTNKVPPAIKKAYLEMETQMVGGGLASKAQRRLAKENAQTRFSEDQRTGKYRQHKMFEVLWDFSQQVLYFSGSKSTQDQLCELFERTFGLTLELINAGSRAKWWAEANGRVRDLEDARPTAFAESKQRLFGTWPEYPWVAKSPEARSWLGNEFLMWLPTLDSIPTKMGQAQAMFDVGVDVECSFGDSGKDTIRNAAPFASMEALAAFQNGKVPRRSHVQLAISGNLFSWTLNAESLGFGGLRLPPIENADTPRVLFEERITMLRDISATLDQMFEQFLDVRFSAAWPSALKEIQKWIESGGKNLPNQKVVAPVGELTPTTSKVRSNSVTPNQAIKMTAQMLERRDQVKNFLGERYYDEVEMATKVLVNRAEETGEPELSVAIALAKEATNAGSEMAGQLFIAAFVERHDPSDQALSTRVANDPKFAKALKGLVKGIGEKDGLTSISITTSDGKGVKIDAEGAKRIRDNCDHVIKGGKLTPAKAEIDPLEAEFNKLDLGVILPSAILRKLHDAGIKKGHQLAKAQRERVENKIKGIGQSLWDQIDSAVADWWLERRKPIAEKSAPSGAASVPEPSKIDQPAKPFEPDWIPVFDMRPHGRILNIDISEQDGKFIWHGSVVCGSWREDFLDSRPFDTKSNCQLDIVESIDRIITPASQGFDEKQLKTVGKIQDALAALKEKIRQSASEIEDWETVALGDLEIGDVTKKKLENAGLITAGQIARAMESSSWDEDSKTIGLSSKATGAIRSALKTVQGSGAKAAA